MAKTLLASTARKRRPIVILASLMVRSCPCAAFFPDSVSRGAWSPPGRNRRLAVHHLGDPPPRALGGVFRQRIDRKEAAGRDFPVGLGHPVLPELSDDID